MGAISDIKSFYGSNPLRINKPPVVPTPKTGKGQSPRFYITPVQFERIRHDIQMWREAIQEAENALYPQRIRMQRIYQDTILNEHVDACIRRRKALTLLRKFKVCNDAGEENKEATKLLQKNWFRNFQSYAIDAILHGYNLISFGDMVNDSLPNLSFVRRQNVSPDRLIVTSLLYSTSGQSFLEDPFNKWFVYVKTPTETGVSPCGYGLLYKIARTEILLRNNLGQNADYNEVFGQPLRKGTTTKQGTERDEFETALRTMGSNPYILLDDGQDSVELVTASGGATAYQTYENLEKRCEARISKVILGHSDALDSTPGKLGSEQGGEESPVQKALRDTQIEDAEFLQPLINEELLPRLRNLGFKIPDELHFEYVNDGEKEAFRKREDESNKVTAQIAQTMKSAGLKMSAEYFEERTGIPTEEAEPPQPPGGPGGAPGAPGGSPVGNPFAPAPGAAKQPEAVKNLLSAIVNFIEGQVPRAPAGTKQGGQWVKEGDTLEAVEKKIRAKVSKSFDKAMTSLTETGGFSIGNLINTLNNKDGSDTEAGSYIVALGGYEKKIPIQYFDKADISSYLNEYKKKFKSEPGLILGGWHNKQDNIVYLDISKAFKDKNEAIKFGKMSKQIAGWDAEKGEEFQITPQKKVKNDLTQQQQSEKLRAMFGGGIINSNEEEDESAEEKD